MSGKSAAKVVVLMAVAELKFDMQKNACQKHQPAQKSKFREKTAGVTFVQHRQRQDTMFGMIGKNAVNRVVRTDIAVSKFVTQNHVSQLDQFVMKYKQREKTVVANRVPPKVE